MKRVFYLLPLALFLVVAGYFAVQLLSGKDPNAIPSALLDRPAPEFALPALYEGAAGFSSADLKGGGPVVVNIFASWCVPCRAEHPILMRMAQDEGITLHGIAYKDKRDAAQGFIDELGNPYTRIGFDGDGRAAIDWGVYGVPETYVIDGQGMIRYKRVGPLSARHLRDDVLPLLEALRR
jgi:cytochrome c biogenesis protein CcmG/thiol:disulfide interchange protein DsbE